MRSRVGRELARVAFVLACVATTVGVASAQRIGPSTSTEPYVLPSTPGVTTTSILTVGDAIGGYPLVGIPDGLGAFKSGHRTFTLLANHELRPMQGAVRAHGSQGAFVSRWEIKRNTLEVLKGEDQTPSPSDVYSWDPVSSQYVQGTVAWNRFCSADLAPRKAFFHGGKGTQDRLYLNGEEANNGTAWAHIATGPHKGQSWQLPRLGRMAFENVVASPHRQLKTVVIGLDDADASTSPIPPNVPSEVYVYIGTKTKHGTPIERAGLTNGGLFGMKVAVNGITVTEESNADGLGSGGNYVGSGAFSLHSFGDVSGLTETQLQDAAIAADVFRMQRVEDGVWDPRPRHKNDFYFVTTASFSTNSRLWRLRFNDIEHPENGGTIEILLTGSEGHKMLDNITMDRLGRLLMQEDIGGQNALGKIWLYDTNGGQLIEIAAHNPAFFAPPVPPALTIDEESSGIIDAKRILGRGWFLLDVQAHFTHSDPALVQGGQLLAMYVDPHIGSGLDDDDEDEDEREDF